MWPTSQSTAQLKPQTCCTCNGLWPILLSDDCVLVLWIVWHIPSVMYFMNLFRSAGLVLDIVILLQLNIHNLPVCLKSDFFKNLKNLEQSWLLLLVFWYSESCQNDQVVSQSWNQVSLKAPKLDLWYVWRRLQPVWCQCSLMFVP